MFRRRGADSDRFLAPYRAAVQRHGASFEATLWASRDAQTLRFDVMIDLVDLGGARVVDAGCGRGDFAARLIERGVAFAAYVGLDAVEPMIESARERVLDEGRVTFEAVDLLEDTETLLRRHRPDWVCISGTLNTMDDDAARSLVQTAYDVSGRGVIFNFLSDRCSPARAKADLTPARRFDTNAWLDWSFGVSTALAFRQDYMDGGHDATVVLARDKPV